MIERRAAAPGEQRVVAFRSWRHRIPAVRGRLLRRGHLELQAPVFAPDHANVTAELARVTRDGRRSLHRVEAQAGAVPRLTAQPWARVRTSGDAKTSRCSRGVGARFSDGTLWLESQARRSGHCPGVGTARSSRCSQGSTRRAPKSPSHQWSCDTLTAPRIAHPRRYLPCTAAASERHGLSCCGRIRLEHDESTRERDVGGASLLTNL